MPVAIELKLANERTSIWPMDWPLIKFPPMERRMSGKMPIAIGKKIQNNKRTGIPFEIKDEKVPNY